MASKIHVKTLGPRPPTPPRDIDDEAVCDAALSLLSSNISYALDTPNESPVAAADLSRSSDRATKHVDFILIPKHIENIENKNPEFPERYDNKLHSRTKKPRRSILKPPSSQLSSDPLSSDPIPSQEEQDFPKMLEDLMRGLVSSDVSARFDAYMVINGCLRTYKDLPSRQALVDKLPTLMSYVRRDLSEFTKGEAVQASRIVQEAMKLAKTLCWDKLTLEAMPTSFQSFLLNHTITGLANERASKPLTNLYLYFLADNGIGAKAMNNEKANRLLSTLKDLHERVRGRQVAALRLTIYCNLIHQARNVMITRVDDWIQFLFAGMLDGTKEIRLRAMGLGSVAGSEIGSEEAVSRAVNHFLKESVPSEGDLTNFEMVKARLEEWIVSKEDGEHVPIIWSNVILLLRSKPSYLERWQYTSPWLRLLQKCFNSSHAKIKTRADDAWIRMIFAISPNSNTSQPMAKMLSIPIRSQLERVPKPKQNPRESALHVYSAYHTLLYYAFRPGADFPTLDRYWQGYVEKIFFDDAGRRLVQPMIAHRILQNLLFQTQVRSWEQRRALGKPSIIASDLPRLDSKWIRSRASAVFRVLEGLLFDEASWSSEDQTKPFMHTWSNLQSALKDAAAKEVKVSTEAVAAMGMIVKTLALYIDSIHAESDVPLMLEWLSHLLTEAIDKLGGLVFNEKRLIRSGPNAFEASETPSARVAKSRGQLASPALHLLSIIVANKVIGEQPMVKHIIKQLYHLAIDNCGSSESRLKLLREMVTFTKPTTLPHSSCKAYLWDLITEGTSADLEGFELLSDSPETIPETGGKLCREAIKILEAGFEQIGIQAIKSWCSAFDMLQRRIRAAAGAGGVAAVFTDPLAGFLEHLIASPEEELAQLPSIHLIHRVDWPASRGDVEWGQQRLWGKANTTKSQAFSPFDHLYKMIDTLLTRLQRSFSSYSNITFKDLMTALQHLFGTCPRPFFGILLRRTHSALHPWIVDQQQLLSVADAESKGVFESVVGLWDIILDRVKEFGNFDSKLLQALAVALEPGFTSKHKVIVNRSLIMWNSTFGATEHLEYPPNLLSALVRLSQIAEVQLPGVNVEDALLEVESTPLEFAKTPEDLDGSEVQKESSVVIPESSVSEAGHVVSTSHLRDIKTPEPTPARRANVGAHLTPRLRHDNSQIQFAAIDSSPTILSAIDSQLLTDRQKEIKERQNKENAGLFPDVGLTPRPISRSKPESTPRLKLNQEDIDKVRIVTEELHSPTLPLTDQMDTFLPSSPTPSRRRSFSRDRPRANVIGVLGELEQIDGTIVHLGGDVPSSPPYYRQNTGIRPINDVEDRGIENSTQASIVPQSVLPYQTRKGSSTDSLGLYQKSNKGTTSEVSDHITKQGSSESSSTSASGMCREQVVPALQAVDRTKNTTQTQEIAIVIKDGQTDVDIDMEDAPSSPFDQEDPVVNQIARELESFSQDTVIVLSPSKMAPSSSKRAKTTSKGKAPVKPQEKAAASSDQEGQATGDTIRVASSELRELEETPALRAKTSSSAPKYSRKKRTLDEAESDAELFPAPSLRSSKRSKPSKGLKWTDEETSEATSSRARRYLDRRGSVIEPSKGKKTALAVDDLAENQVSERESSPISHAETAAEKLSSPLPQAVEEPLPAPTVAAPQPSGTSNIWTAINNSRPSRDIAAELDILVAQARAGIRSEEYRRVLEMGSNMIKMALNKMEPQE